MLSLLVVKYQFVSCLPGTMMRKCLMRQSPAALTFSDLRPSPRSSLLNTPTLQSNWSTLGFPNLL